VAGDITAELATVTVARVRLIGAFVVSAGVALAAAACSDDDSAGGGAAASTSAAGGASVVATTSAVAASTPPTPDSAAPSTAPVIPTEPTGVPGLDDPDAFCASWAVYAGTLQAIAVAQAFGGLSTMEITRLEMVAAAHLSRSVTGIGANWPPELFGERAAVLTSYVGPFDRRAQKALQILSELGVTEDEFDELAATWDRALRRRVPEQPVIDVPRLSPRLEEIVGQAAQRFDAAVTPFGDDPSLDVSGVAKPLTDVYLSEHCPDLASIGVGDQV
jgi:hypothetical protein